jgi:hypothetical protein
MSNIVGQSFNNITQGGVQALDRHKSDAALALHMKYSSKVHKVTTGAG